MNVAYLCPVCWTELIRVDPQQEEPPQSADDLRNYVGLATTVECAVSDWVARRMHAHYASIERALAQAVETHKCTRPLSFALWKVRHRAALASASA